MKNKNPFPGIRPFDESDSEFFFGREQQIKTLEKKLLDTNFVSVVGLSASGKSSLIRAGLIPKLKKTGNWDICIMRPQNSPIFNLAATLKNQSNKSKDDTKTDNGWRDFIYSNLVYSSYGIIETYQQSGNQKKLLLVVDQFEELFTYSESSNFQFKDTIKDEGLLFSNLLTTTVNQKGVEIYILITIRSDFVGDCSKFRGLPELINDGQFLVPRLTRNELKGAIKGPLEVQKTSISPLLLNTILNDINEDPDQLPAMQHALMRTWNHWKENYPESTQIRQNSYQAVGGMNNSIGRHADEIFNAFQGQQDRNKEKFGSFSSEKNVKSDKEYIIELFKQLATIENGKSVRKPTSVHNLKKLLDISLEDLDRLTFPFRKEGVNFLLPSKEKLNKEDTIDVSHEAFIRKWDKIRLWIEEERQDIKMLNKLFDNYIIHTHKNDTSETLGIDFLTRIKKNQKFIDLTSKKENKKKAEIWIESNLNRDSEFKVSEKGPIDLSGFSNFINRNTKGLFWRRYKIYIFYSAFPLAFFIYLIVLINNIDKEKNTAIVEKETAIENKITALDQADSTLNLLDSINWQNEKLISDSVLLSNVRTLDSLKTLGTTLTMVQRKQNNFATIEQKERQTNVKRDTVKVDIVNRDRSNLRWVKEGFFLFYYDNIRVTLSSLDSIKMETILLICEIGPNNLCSERAVPVNLKPGQSKEVFVRNIQYGIYLDRIDDAGLNPLKKAAFIDFKRLM